MFRCGEGQAASLSSEVLLVLTPANSQSSGPASLVGGGCHIREVPGGLCPPSPQSLVLAVRGQGGSLTLLPIKPLYHWLHNFLFNIVLKLLIGHRWVPPLAVFLD